MTSDRIRWILLVLCTLLFAEASFADPQEVPLGRGNHLYPYIYRANGTLMGNRVGVWIRYPDGATEQQMLQKVAKILNTLSDQDKSVLMWDAPENGTHVFAVGFNSAEDLYAYWSSFRPITPPAPYLAKTSDTDLYLVGTYKNLEDFAKDLPRAIERISKQSSGQ